MMVIRLAAAAALAMAFVAPWHHAGAYQFKSLYSFCAKGGTACTDGRNVSEGVIVDKAGNVYGGTYDGGTHNDGVIFRLGPNDTNAQSTETVLYNFCSKPNCVDGSHPISRDLVMDKQDRIYGTTTVGGAHNQGVVFELKPNAAKTKWTQTVLYSFCAKSNCADGSDPYAGVIVDKSGKLYGTTYKGGAHNEGVVFELKPNAATTKWTETVLYSFCAKSACADGSSPLASLIMDGSDRLFGTTSAGGAFDGGNAGAVFMLTPNKAKTAWTETVIYSFCASTNCPDGSYPYAALIMDKAKNFYGTTQFGGNGSGAAFILKPNGAKTHWTGQTLYAFCNQQSCADGGEPSGSLFADKLGNLYGTTYRGGAHNQGAIYRLVPNTARTLWTEGVIYSFCATVVMSSCADGANPFAGFVADKSGNLYSTTQFGGIHGSNGTVFELTQ